MTAAQAPLPYYSDPLYQPGAGPHVCVEVVGSIDTLDPLNDLPEFDGEVDWALVPWPCKPSGHAEYTFVLWSKFATAQLHELLTAGKHTAIIVLAQPGDQVPTAIDGRRIARLVSEGSLIDAMRSLVPALVLPLIYRSSICLDYADLEFALGLGGSVHIFERQAHGDGRAVIQKVVDDALTTLNAQQDDDVCAVVLQGPADCDPFLYADKIGKIIHELPEPRDRFKLIATFQRTDTQSIASILTVTRDKR